MGHGSCMGHGSRVEVTWLVASTRALQTHQRVEPPLLDEGPRRRREGLLARHVADSEEDRRNSEDLPAALA